VFIQILRFTRLNLNKSALRNSHVSLCDLCVLCG
jgi:hypothetical protein